MSNRAMLLRVVMLVGLCVVGRSLTAAEEEKKPVDKFAEIGKWKIDYSNRNLVPINPPVLPKRLLPMDAQGTPSAFQPAAKMTTPEQVREELQRQRDLHAPFLKSLSPALDDQRIRVPVDSFDWRIETDTDRTNFAGTLAGQGEWRRVNIPHYGPPMGRAVTYYRTEFEVTQPMLDKGAVFACFKGVDYKAHVFVNGALVGSHEGYFAPFEFDVTPHVRLGRNVLLVKVENDYIMLGNSADRGFVPGGVDCRGDKIFACGGPCWDEPEVGWHECPPGMGISQEVTIEARRRVHLNDLFVRPLNEKGDIEVWVEVFACDPKPQDKKELVDFELSIFGRNFSATALRDERRPSEGGIRSGVNYFKIPLTISEPRLWNLEHPWLYQLQVKLLDDKGNLLDTAQRQFGVRTFRMEFDEEPKGRMYLNGESIKLRGANTMGALQQCVIQKNWDHLIDNILLAKMTHMNYMRLTQTPVQSEIYDYCDRLGLLLQTDLPNFGVVRRRQFCEVIRQAEEMERLVRAHPSNIMVTYINEPSEKGHSETHSNITRDEMTNMFEACDMVVHMANPDRVTKAVDGDYDPPGPGLPDNHCYCGWYNGHGIDLGKLHKGYWQNVKPGWVYACGEFGCEGLDSVALMRKYYPKSWLPQTAEEDKKWTPSQIPSAQTGRMHYYFFDTPHSMAEWAEKGREHQAWATRIMTEAFRRDSRMHSFAIHLFTDNFPDGWMKSILDTDRQPKPAWFAYREALTPLAVNLRSDRRTFFAGEPIDVEAWICNDRNDAPEDAKLCYQIESDGKVLQSGSTAATIPVFDTAFQGTLSFRPLNVTSRTPATIRLALLGSNGQVLHDTAIGIEIFPRQKIEMRRIYVIGDQDGKAAQLARDMDAKVVFNGPMRSDDAIVIDDMEAFAKVESQVAKAVKSGAKALFLELPRAKYRIAETDVNVGGAPEPHGIHFVSRATGHALVEGFQPDDFKFWYDARKDYPWPMLNLPAFEGDGWEPILLSFGTMAAGMKPDGAGSWCLCQIELSGRTTANPIATLFAQRLLAKKNVK